MIKRSQITQYTILEIIAICFNERFHRTFNSSDTMPVDERLELGTDISARVCWHAKLMLMPLLKLVQGFYKSVMFFHFLVD